MINSYVNQVVLVTGGGSGIGKATALAFAQAGARVAVAGRSLPACNETAALIHSLGGKSISIGCDISCEDQVKSLCERVENELGPIDAAFLNAGVGTASAIVEQDVELFEQVMRINCTGLMICLKHLLRSMYQRKAGAIVTNLSVHAYRNIFEGTAAYTASKHAAWAITKAAAIESARHGVRVNGILPGPIHTEMLIRSSAISGGVAGWAERLLMKRVGLPAEVAEAVMWLCSPSASFISGSAIPVDGGFLAT